MVPGWVFGPFQSTKKRPISFQKWAATVKHLCFYQGGPTGIPSDIHRKEKLCGFASQSFDWFAFILEINDGRKIPKIDILSRAGDAPAGPGLGFNRN